MGIIHRLVVLAAVSGCVENQAATLFNGKYVGQASYSATVAGHPQGFAGAAPLDVIDDGDRTMQLGTTCELAFADIMLATDSRGRGTSATAALSGATCTVPVDGGTATFAATTGSATSTGGTSLAVSVGGDLASWHGTATTGYIKVEFDGLWVSN
jgi:hypothetical protein